MGQFRQRVVDTRKSRCIASTVVLVMVSLALSGCGCNLVGCADGLRVHLTSLPAVPVQVELLVAGIVQAAPLNATCSESTQCYQDIYFQTAATDRVSVRVTTSAGTRLTEFAKVVYAKSFPNGKGCSPTCLKATVTAIVP